MEVQKKKRIKDRNLLDQYRFKPCAICRKTPSEAHHLKSKGAGGNDHPSNLVPLCREHHIQIHQLGLARMCQQHPQLDFEIKRIKTLK